MRRAIALLAALVVALFTNIAHAAPSGSWTDHAALSYAGGDGSAASPYLIETAEQLALLAKSTNEDTSRENDSTLRKHYALTSDIDLSAHCWTPIGEGIGPSVPSTASMAFRGHFDGRGHVISGLTPHPSDARGFKNTYFGLFGRIVGQSSTDRSNIKDVVMRDISFDMERTYTGSLGGELRVGVLAGSANNAVISGCTADASISVRYDGYDGNVLQLGGLIGFTDSDVTISDVYTSGSLRAVNYGSSNVGGLTAYCGGSNSISQAASSCAVHAESTFDGDASVRAGGLAGSVYYANSVITTSFATGDATAVSPNTDDGDLAYTAAGGLAAECEGKIEDCFATGRVRSQSAEPTGAETFAGGLVGRLTNSIASVKSSYAYGAVMTNGTKIGGLCGEANSATQVDAATFWRSDAPGTGATVGGGSSQARGTAEFVNNAALLSALGENWAYSDVDGMARPQLKAFFPSGTMVSGAAKVTPASVTITAGETRELALSALGFERTVTLSFEPSSLGGARIAQSTADRSRIIITTEAVTTDATREMTVTAPGLPPMKFSLTVTAGGSSADDGDDAGAVAAPDAATMPSFMVITPPSGIISHDMEQITSEDFAAHGELTTVSSRDAALLIDGQQLAPTADAIRVELQLGADTQAALAVRLSLQLDMFGTTRRASDAETADELDASGRAFCFTGIDRDAEAYKIVGGIGALISWRGALERGFITFVDDEVVLGCIITNEREARVPYVAGSFIALPDGLYDDRIAMLLFPAVDAHRGGSGGNCITGAFAPSLLALLVILSRGGRRRSQRR